VESVKVGRGNPGFRLTEKGKRLVLVYLEAFKDKLVIFRTEKLPYHVEDRSPKLRTEKR
jgi:hypothetical protein